MKQVQADEFSLSELKDLAQTLNVKVKAKDTKPKLVAKINSALEGLNASEDTPSDSETSDAETTMDVVETPTIVEEEIKREYLAPKHHKGYHPITGKPVN